ncbi:hypothetical protein V493_08174 [Pseudogymnoascus sp. VKM F-4281 (FW-2241)]|nr:hypothetical protein V493_08174 [Pseudogymnoascus sp. VKM F-4281 (FW-2241)]
MAYFVGSVSKGYRKGLELGGVEEHLVRAHGVEETLARGVQIGIRAAQDGKGRDEEECWIVDERKQSVEKKAEDETMGDNGGQIISREEAMLASSIVVNEEFQRMICKECELAVGLGMVGLHLSKRHSVKRDIAQRIANLIDMGEWGCVEGKEKKAKKPENGTRLHKWLMVFNMLQCTFCREFHARLVDEVESYWHRAGHGKAEGAKIKPVRMQL